MKIFTSILLILNLLALGAIYFNAYNAGAILPQSIFLLVSISLITTIPAFALIKAPISEFGDSKKEKLQAFQGLTVNFYIVVALCTILIARHLKFIEKELFLASFFAGVSALGIKLVADFKSK